MRTYAFPTNIASIKFENPDGSCYTGPLEIKAFHSINNALVGTLNGFTITDGYLDNPTTHVDKTIGNAGYAFYNKIYYIFYCVVTASEAEVFVGHNCQGYTERPDPGPSNPTIVACTVNISIDLTINGGETPVPIKLYIDNIIEQPGLTYSGDLYKYELRMMDNVLFQESMPSGNVDKDFNLITQERQMNLSDFQISEGKITNNSGASIPSLVIYSM